MFLAVSTRMLPSLAAVGLLLLAQADVEGLDSPQDNVLPTNSDMTRIMYRAAGVAAVCATPCAPCYPLVGIPGAVIIWNILTSGQRHWSPVGYVLDKYVLFPVLAVCLPCLAAYLFLATSEQSHAPARYERTETYTAAEQKSLWGLALEEVQNHGYKVIRSQYDDTLIRGSQTIGDQQATVEVVLEYSWLRRKGTVTVKERPVLGFSGVCESLRAATRSHPELADGGVKCL